jgi:hypothetical protein
MKWIKTANRAEWKYDPGDYWDNFPLTGVMKARRFGVPRISVIRTTRRKRAARKMGRRW